MPNPTLDRGRLVATMAFALRHDPGCLGLELDDEGWASFEDLIIAIRFRRYDWADLDVPLVKSIIEGMECFEVHQGKIRAVYGHSVELAKLPPITAPPAVLFHGTSSDNVPSILQQGVLRMRRRFVHFSSDFDWVVRFLDDKPSWTLFSVDTQHALDAGLAFRKANNHVWLTELMALRFLSIHSTGQGTPVLAEHNIAGAPFQAPNGMKY